MNFKSLPALLDHFKDEKTCIEYYEKLRWNGKPVCPFCNSDKKPYKTKRGYKCSNNECYKKFTVKVGTIFESSKIPFRTWFAAIYICTSHKKGISSHQLRKDLGVTQKTGWFILQRIREMLKNQAPTMIGGGDAMVEADEAYCGGREANKHFPKRRSDKNPSLRNDGTPFKDKKVVLGIIERDGKVVLRHVANATKKNMVDFIGNHVPQGSRIITDDYKGYSSLGEVYKHDTINHTLKVYVVGDCHTNTIENFWSVLKRGLYGIYHNVSDKHFERYLNEFAARFNSRKLAEDVRFEQFLANSGGGLLYKNLIA